MIKTIAMFLLAVTIPSSTAFTLCIERKPTKEEYAEADKKFGVDQDSREFTLKDAKAIMYADELTRSEFNVCVSREEELLMKSGQERYIITPAGNVTYRFDKITGKTWVVTPSGYRELKDTTPRQ